MGSARLGRHRLGVTTSVLVLLTLAACAQGRPTSALNPSPTPTPTPAVATGTCTDGSPSAGCAEKLASDLGFAVLWAPVPAGWQLRQGLAAQPGTTTASEDVASGGLDVGMVSGDTNGVPPGMHAAGTIQWHGSRVALWRGVPDPSSFPSGFPAPAWVVSARWTYQGQSYNVGILANPELGPTGTPQEGMKLLLRVLHHGVRYANP